MSSERKKKKKRLLSALRAFQKYRKKLSKICGKFESIEEWNVYADEATSLINEYSLIPKNISSPILEFLQVSRTTVDVVNDICDTLDGKLDGVLDWIETETKNMLDDIETDEPMRSQYAKNQPTRNTQSGTNTMSTGSGSATKFVVVGIIIAIVIGGFLGYTYLLNNNSVVPPPRTFSDPRLSLVDVTPSDGTIVEINFSSYTIAPVKGASQEFRAKILINDRTTLVGGHVTFWINDGVYRVSPDSSDGIAKLVITLPYGTHVWKAQASNEGYQSSPVIEQKFTLQQVR